MTSPSTALRGPQEPSPRPAGTPSHPTAGPGAWLEAHPRGGPLALFLAAYAALAAVTVSIGLVLGSSHLASVDDRDERVNRWFVGQRTPLDDRLTSFASTVANTPAVVAIAAVAVVLFALAHRRRQAAILVVGLSLEVTVFLTATLAVDRERPDVPKLDDAPPTSSFPSGHTAAAVVLYLGLALLCSSAVRQVVARAALLVVAALVPAGVAIARLYRGMHHPTDVMAGALLGLACLGLAVLIVRAVASARSRSEGGGP